MRSKLLLFVLLLSSFCVKAQDIAVSSFKLLETDMDANLQGTRVVDQNGETAALIKIVTTEKGFGFSCGAIGIVKTVETPGEIWLYVPRGAQKITIKHPQLGVLRDWYFTTAIKGGRTYEMVLTTGRVETIVKKSRTTQYVVFNLTPKDAVVELNGEILHTVDGVATKMVKFGTYEYQIKAPDYVATKGKVEVNDPNDKKIVNISLKPNFSTVTLITDESAEIWINGDIKGKGTWTGNLGAGIYEFETKRDKYRPYSLTKEIGVSETPIKIYLDSPKPITGEANINSVPANADVFLDGKKVAVTPQILPNILIGEHKLKITKDGYNDYDDIIIVKEDIENSITAQLIRKKEIKVQQQYTCDIKVTYFNKEEYDFSAYSGKYVKKDKNGEKCALIKISLPESGFTFDGENKEIVEIVEEDNELWLYVSPRSYMLNIHHPLYGTLKYNYSLLIEGGCTYKMDISNGKGRYYLIKPWIDCAKVYIDGRFVGNSPIKAFVSYGKHDVKAIFENIQGNALLENNPLSSDYGTKEFNIEMDQGGELRIQEEKYISIFDLGIDVRPITDSQKKKLGIENGIEIVKLKDGIFKTAGIPQKLIITHINNEIIATEKDLDYVLREFNRLYKNKLVVKGFFNNSMQSYTINF